MGHENGGWMNSDQRDSMKPAKEKPSEAGSNPSAGAAQSGGQLLPCGHDVSNRDTALESGTEFCRFCDLQGRCRDAETMEKEFREKYTKAAKLVADMHCAAVGSVRGPIRGVVEDITNLRIDRDRLLTLIKRVAETPLMAHVEKMLPPQRDALLALREAAQGGPL